LSHPAPQRHPARRILLDAIARSNGTRSSVRANLFTTKVSQGILGAFSIDRNGDTTAGAVTIYRIVGGTPQSHAGTHTGLS
jgi:ABC-type branched-subunit amino acid transport system substrate-binding protein